MIKNNNKLVLVAFLLAPLFTSGIVVGGMPNAYAGGIVLSVSMDCVDDPDNVEIDFIYVISNLSQDSVLVNWTILGDFSDTGSQSLPSGESITNSFSVPGFSATASISVIGIDDLGNSIIVTDEDSCVFLPPSIILVDIDVKPGSDPNSVNSKSKGVLPVAILTTDTFDATTVDPETVIFDIFEINGSTPPNKCAIEDVDGDGDLDLVCHFSIPDIEKKCQGIVDGRVVHATGQILADTFGGLPIQGLDSIR